MPTHTRSVIGQVNVRGAVLVTRALECILCAYGPDGVRLLEPQLSMILDACLETALGGFGLLACLCMAWHFMLTVQ